MKNDNKKKKISKEEIEETPLVKEEPYDASSSRSFTKVDMKTGEADSYFPIVTFRRFQTR